MALPSNLDQEKEDLDQKELETLIKMFDRALTSQDPRIVDALRQLMVIVTLTSNDDTEKPQTLGPLRAMQKQLVRLSDRVSSLEYEVVKAQQMAKSNGASPRFDLDRINTREYDEYNKMLSIYGINNGKNE